MATNATNTEERSTAITRFLLVFIICLLCAIIPLYYLFSLPDKALDKLKVSASSYKNQQEKIEGFDSLSVNLDKLMKDKNFGKEFDAGVKDIYSYAKNNFDQKDPYKPLFLKISDLYDNIFKMVESNDLKAVNEKLSNQIEILENEKKEMEKEMKALEKDNMKLLYSK